MKKKIKKFVFGIVISPAVVWMCLYPKDLLGEWVKIPSYFKTNIASLVSPDKTAKIDVARWNSFGKEREDALSKAYYNKGYIIIDDFFSFTTYLSPRFYFQSGDGTPFTPKGVEPIAIPAFVFWVMGIIAVIKKGNYKYLYLPPIFALLAYLFGHKNLAFLFPVLALYVGLVIKGLGSIKNRTTREISYIFLIIYGLFLIGRMILLNV
ncbi:MAG TPA: hypothetical protein VJ227_03310 [Patescibacteria group bacterium]|nr:hypothetical protein [Patescibacteria group bacterium]